MAQRPVEKRSKRESARCRYWREQIDAWMRSGETQAAFCRRKGLSAAAFSWWKSELKRRALWSGPEVGRARGKEVQPQGHEVFVPIQVKSSGLGMEADGRLEVALPNGSVVRVPEGFDAAGLTRLLDVLESRC